VRVKIKTAKPRRMSHSEKCYIGWKIFREALVYISCWF